MNKEKILIIDDSKTFALYLTRILAIHPEFEIKTIQDPRLALEVAEQFLPDLILTDFDMPHLNGNEVCTLLKKSPKLSLIPIMMITANSSEDYLIRAIECGADDFLYKDAQKEVVIIKVKAMLRQKKLMESDARLKQFEAVSALIATTKHEFNNAIFISNGFLLKLKRKNNPEFTETLQRIEDVNVRMYNIVKKLEALKEVNLTTISGDMPMLKI
jgi:DNA-binding response OmpR family regulator